MPPPGQDARRARRRGGGARRRAPSRDAGATRQPPLRGAADPTAPQAAAKRVTPRRRADPSAAGRRVHARPTLPAHAVGHRPGSPRLNGATRTLRRGCAPPCRLPGPLVHDRAPGAGASGQGRAAPAAGASTVRPSPALPCTRFSSWPMRAGQWPAGRGPRRARGSGRGTAGGRRTQTGTATGTRRPSVGRPAPRRLFTGRPSQQTGTSPTLRRMPGRAGARPPPEHPAPSVAPTVCQPEPVVAVPGVGPRMERCGRTCTAIVLPVAGHATPYTNTAGQGFAAGACVPCQAANVASRMLARKREDLGGRRAARVAGSTPPSPSRWSGPQPAPPPRRGAMAVAGHRPLINLWSKVQSPNRGVLGPTQVAQAPVCLRRPGARRPGSPPPRDGARPPCRAASMPGWPAASP